MRDRKKFIRLLSKVEYGVAVFCFKLQREATQEGRDELAHKLGVHAVQEDKHGKMLGAIADGTAHITRTGNGRWVNIFKAGQNIVKNSIPASSKSKILRWDSTKYPGEKLTGIQENFNGLSYRYLAGRLLFRGRAAFDYLWPDRLGLMYALEEETGFFYQQMLEVLDEKIRAIAASIKIGETTIGDIKKDNSKIKEIKDLTNIRSIILLIIGDELNHANYLKDTLNDFTAKPEEIIQKWRDRIFWARPGLVIDLIYFFLIK